MGGHRTLISLDNYTSSVNTYIDSEVLTLIRKNIKIDNKEKNKLMNLVYNMSTACPVPIEDTFETEVNNTIIGLCTAKKELKMGTYTCKDELCYNCNKWWCKPNDTNFLKLEEIVKKKVVDKTNKLNRDLSFFKYLLKNLGFECVGDKLIVDNKTAEGIKRLSLELKSNSKDIIHLAYKLTDPTDENITLITKLDDILPTEEINQYFNDNLLIE